MHYQDQMGGGRGYTGQRTGDAADAEAIGGARNLESQQESYQNNLMMNSQVGNQNNYQQKTGTAMSVRTSGNMNQSNKIQQPGTTATTGNAANTSSTRGLLQNTNMYQ